MVERSRAEAAAAAEEMMATLPDKVRNDPGVEATLFGMQRYLDAVSTGLRRAALGRLANGDIIPAADSAAKALSVATSTSFQSEVAESWLLVAWIHAHAGRFETASGQLEHAEHSGAANPILNGTTNYLGPLGPILDIPGDWTHRLDSLRSRVAQGVRPSIQDIPRDLSPRTWHGTAIDPRGDR